MSDAIDSRLQAVVDAAFALGLGAALQVIVHHIDDATYEGIAEAAVELAIDVAKHEISKALAGSGRVDVTGGDSVPVVIKVH